MGARGDLGQQGCFHKYVAFLAGGGHVEREEEEEAWLWQVPLSPRFPFFTSSQRSKLEGDGVEKGSSATRLNQCRKERTWNIKVCCKSWKGGTNACSSSSAPSWLRRCFACSDSKIQTMSPTGMSSKSTRMCGDYLIDYVCVFIYIAYDFLVAKRKTIFS